MKPNAPDTQDYHIAPADSRDIPSIAEFQIRMAMETEKLQLDEPTVYKGVEYIFSHPATGFYIVARGAADRTIASLLVLKEWSDWRNAHVWWIHSVYVTPDFRGQGIFSSMFRYVEKLAYESGARGLRLYVEKDNENAKAVYSRLDMTGDHYDLYEKMF
ncbi:MAG: GNAT family N-acetyltransferase [candidate division KSB1 bacterium]|jgi:GNAT superfamily N-acetyltransferase|nr:GNAT family N-acetyltransferase [candidate division KSB1 bacterium]